jgi:uncharacterized FAD-dependent dehydrogenase
VYGRLYEAGVQLETKVFAVGFRIEHPQKLINKIRYGREWWGPTVVTGNSRADAANQELFERKYTTGHRGKLPVISYRLARNGPTRGVYSFCMCPGGQIVPSSTEPEEVCVDGMNFSKRDSLHGGEFGFGGDLTSIVNTWSQPRQVSLFNET